jgi:acyl dehydratase
MATSTEFEKATNFELKESDIERARALVGRYSASQARELFTAASHDVLRNFAHGYGDDNPLFCTEEYGETTRWKGQIAPPMTGIGLNGPLLADPPVERLKRPSFRGIHVFVSGSTWEWYRPVLAGDRLYSFGGTESVEVKDSEFADRSVLITFLNVKLNQRAEVVASMRVLAIHAERKTAREKGKYKAIEAATYTDDDMARLDAIYQAEEVRGADPRWWEDVQVGDAIGPMAKGPLTTTDMIVFHAGGYGFTPYTPCANRLAYANRQRIAPFYVKNEHGVPDVAQRVHWDSAWAQAIGNPMAYDYGVMRDCWLTHLLTDWMGDDGWLVRQHSEIRKFNYIGDSHVLTGEVTAKRIENGRYLVDIDMRGTNQRGDVTCPGSATVALPSREGGRVVALPDAPSKFSDEAQSMMTRHRELTAERKARGSTSPLP